MRFQPSRNFVFPARERRWRFPWRSALRPSAMAQLIQKEFLKDQPLLWRGPEKIQTPPAILSAGRKVGMNQSPAPERDSATFARKFGGSSRISNPDSAAVVIARPNHSASQRCRRPHDSATMRPISVESPSRCSTTSNMRIHHLAPRRTQLGRFPLLPWQDQLLPGFSRFFQIPHREKICTARTLSSCTASDSRRSRPTMPRTACPLITRARSV